MDKTQFAGLTRLAPDDSLSEDNASFQTANPVITDRLLKRAIEHHHTGAPGLADPTVAPTAEALDNTGVIPADTTLLVSYTWVDALGGETAPAPVATITTAEAMEEPDDEPTLVVETTAGSLGIGSYAYAVSYTDGAGGETPVGPLVEISRDPGPANAQVVISGLSTIVDASPSAAGWRLYRSRDGAQFYLLAEGSGSMDEVTDDGSLCVDCTDTPLEDANTTNSTNALRVTLPAIPDDATSVRIYASDLDVFATPSLLAELDPAAAASPQTFTTYDPLDGAPPDTSQSLTQPTKINGDTEIAGPFWRAPVANSGALPATGNTTGDARLALNTRAYYVWDGDSWEAMPSGGGGGTGGHTIEDEGSSLTARTSLNFVGAGVAVTDDSGNDRTVVTIDGGGAALSFLGPWDDVTDYPLGSLVEHDGIVWLADDDMEAGVEPSLDAPDVTADLQYIGVHVMEFYVGPFVTNPTAYAPMRYIDVATSGNLAVTASAGAAGIWRASDDTLAQESVGTANLAVTPGRYYVGAGTGATVTAVLSAGATPATPGGWTKFALYEAGESGGAGLTPRATVAAPGGSLAAGASAQPDLAMAPTFKLLRVQSSAGDFRLRLYSSSATRTADLARDAVTQPSGDHGVLLDASFETGDTSVYMTPPIDGYSKDGTATIYATITNTSGSTQTLDLTLTYDALEAVA